MGRLTDRPPARGRCRDDSLVNAKQNLAEAVEDLVDVLGERRRSAASIGAIDRANLAKYLTIAKLRLENAIALVRSDDAGVLSGPDDRRPAPPPRAATPASQAAASNATPTRLELPGSLPRGPASPARPTRAAPTAMTAAATAAATRATAPAPLGDQSVTDGSADHDDAAARPRPATTTGHRGGSPPTRSPAARSRSSSARALAIASAAPATHRDRDEDRERPAASPRSPRPSRRPAGAGSRPRTAATTTPCP